MYLVHPEVVLVMLQLQQKATEAIAAKSGSALETSINGKTSPGKAIALSMVFG